MHVLENSIADLALVHSSVFIYEVIRFAANPRKKFNNKAKNTVRWGIGKISYLITETFVRVHNFLIA